MNFEGMTAKAIAEWLLKRTGQAMHVGDFDTFFSCFAVPYFMSTFEGQQFLNNVDDFRRVFNQVRSHHAAAGATEIVRHCVDAAFVDSDLIKSTHLTRVIGKDQLLQDPYPVYSEIRLQENTWLITRSDYAVTDAPAHIAALTGQT